MRRIGILAGVLGIVGTLAIAAFLSRREPVEPPMAPHVPRVRDDFSHRTRPQEDTEPLEQADIFLPPLAEGEGSADEEDYRPIVETDRSELPLPRRDETRKHYGAYRPLPPK